jgi:hypothetical protein
MRRLLIGVLVVGVVSVLALGNALAERVVDPQPIDRATVTEINLGPTGFSEVCQVGNLNAPAFALSNFIVAPEEYKLTFDPKETCSVCPIGFLVNTVHFLIQTQEAMTIFCAVNVEEAEYPNSPDCPEPGELLCMSGTFQVDIPGGGLWDIGLPIACECYTMERKYLLSVHFEDIASATGTVPDLITDAGPAALCTNWNNYGAGWYDLVDAFPTWPGDLIFFADAECCTPPVPVEDKTWGAIKDLYDN